jgi:hypothetical protein
MLQQGLVTEPVYSLSFSRYWGCNIHFECCLKKCLIIIINHSCFF